MLITETNKINRECCSHDDLVKYRGTRPNGHDGRDFMFCKHCGQLHVRKRFMDVAGSGDWEWVKVVATGLDQ